MFAGKMNSIGGDLRDPVFAVMEMTGGALATVDICGELSCEQGVVSLAESNPVVVKHAGDLSGCVPADWRERFIVAYDVELSEWMRAASDGGATGPSAWDAYAITAVSDAGLEAAKTGEAAEVRLVDRPGLYA